MTEPLVVRRETQIAAPPATVFAFLTDPEKIMSWMGTEVKTEVHPGGLYLIKGVNGRVARGAFREVVPVHRLAYSFGGRTAGSASFTTTVMSVTSSTTRSWFWRQTPRLQARGPPRDKLRFALGRRRHLLM